MPNLHHLRAYPALRVTPGVLVRVRERLTAGLEAEPRQPPLGFLPWLLASEGGEVEEVVRAAALGAAGVGGVGVEHALVDKSSRPDHRAARRTTRRARRGAEVTDAPPPLVELTMLAP
jgi:hypothetical protein